MNAKWVLAIGAIAVAGAVAAWFTIGRAPPLPTPIAARAIVGGALDTMYRAAGSEPGAATLDSIVTPSQIGSIRDRLAADLTRFDLDALLAAVSLVTVLDLAVSPTADGFRASTTWMVASHVMHEGHTHGKVVEYDGVLEMIPNWEGGDNPGRDRWRVAAFSIDDARPVGEPGADPSGPQN